MLLTWFIKGCHNYTSFRPRSIASGKSLNVPWTKPWSATSIVSAPSQSCQGLQHMPPNPWCPLHNKQRSVNGARTLMCTHVSLSLRLTLSWHTHPPRHQMSSRLDSTDSVRLGKRDRKDWNQMRWNMLSYLSSRLGSKEICVVMDSNV